MRRQVAAACMAPSSLVADDVRIKVVAESKDARGSCHRAATSWEHHRVAAATAVGLMVAKGADLEAAYPRKAVGCFDLLTLCKLNFV